MCCTSCCSHALGSSQGKKGGHFCYMTRFSRSRSSLVFFFENTSRSSLVDIAPLFLFCKITCHPSFIGDLPTFRAVESNVQVSGELTTSRGPGTAFQFALSFVEQLFGPHAVEDVDSTLVCQNKTCISLFCIMAFSLLDNLL